MKIFLDIDDTILYNTVETADGKRYLRSYPAKHFKEFLQNALAKHEVYWLTTHCDGDASDTVLYISRYFDTELMDLVVKIKPTTWKSRKIEAINLDEDFLWFDDVLTSSEEKDLEKAGKLGSYIKVNLEENPDFWQDWLDV